MSGNLNFEDKIFFKEGRSVTSRIILKLINEFSQFLPN